MSWGVDGSGMCLWKGNLADIYKLGGKRGHEGEEEILAGKAAVRTKGEN